MKADKKRQVIRKMAQLMKDLLHTHEDLGLVPGTHAKKIKQGGVCL